MNEDKLDVWLARVDTKLDNLYHEVRSSNEKQDKSFESHCNQCSVERQRIWNKIDLLSKYIWMGLGAACLVGYGITMYFG